MSDRQTRGSMPAHLRTLWEAQLAGLDRPDIERKFQLCQTAAAEQSFSGWLRRAMHEAGLPLTQLAEHAQIPADRLAAFLEGETELSTREVDRLCISLDVTPVGSR
jgi:hypothetical protein